MPALSFAATYAAICLPRRVPPTRKTLAPAAETKPAISSLSPSTHSAADCSATALSAPKAASCFASVSVSESAVTGWNSDCFNSSAGVNNCFASADSSENTKIPGMLLFLLLQALCGEAAYQLRDVRGRIGFLESDMLPVGHEALHRSVNLPRLQLIGSQTEIGDLDFLLRLLGGAEHLLEVDLTQHAKDDWPLHGGDFGGY